MSTNYQWKRLLSLFLVLVMVITMVPMHGHAAEGEVVDAAIIFTDLHTSSSDYKESTVKNIFGTLKNTGLPFSSVTSGGDAFSVNADSTKYTGDPTKITGYIHSALGDSSIPVSYVWSDHDRYAVQDKTSHLVYGAGTDGVYGTADDDNYYVYSLSMGDLCSYDRYKAGFNYTQTSNNRAANGFTATVDEAIANFEADAAKLNKDRPLFIVSHQPLFDNRNDNAFAEDWFDAINAVAEDMDVAFFYGHNHKYDTGNDYYYAKGSTMPVATADNWGWDYDVGEGYLPSMNLTSENKVLNFTHMCAGYMAPDSTGSTSSTTRSGTVMVITIYEDSVRYTTYNKSGIYTGSYAVDKTVVRDHAVTEPELIVSGDEAYFVGDELNLTVNCKTGSKLEDVTAQAVLSGYDMNTAGDQTVTVSYNGMNTEFAIQVREKIFRDVATGVAVEVQAPGATALTVSTVDADSDVFQGIGEMLSGAVGYEIRLADHEAGTQTNVSLPIPAGVTSCTVYRVGDDGAISEMTATEYEGNALFTTDSFGYFLIGQEEISEPLENSVVAGGVSYEEKTVYVRVDSLENGGKYILVGENKPSGGDPIAYLNNSGSEGWEVVTINSDSVTSGSTTYSKGYLETTNANAVWTASGDSSSGYTLTNGGRYVGGTDANTLKSSSSEAVKVTYDSAASRLKTASGTTRYLYYSTYGSENWKWSTSANSSTSSRNMWIYQEVKVKTAVSAPVTYTMQAQNLQHVLSENTAQLKFALLADGVAAELPNGAAYAFEVVGDNSGIISNISGDGVIAFTGTPGSCFVKICCSWSEGTVYKYVKVTAEADPNACVHEYTASVQDATCTEAGSVTYICRCGDSYTEEIPAKGHDYKSVVTAPTCTAEGYTTYTCDCGDSYIADEVAALGHSYEAVTVDATCTEAGSITYTCACGDSYAEVIAATGHDFESVVTAPTCTEKGYTTYTCDCGDSYIADEVAALGHSYEAVTVDATCTEDGSITYTCACGDSYVEVIEAVGHDYESVITAPTCTENGSITYTCACGDSYVEVIETVGHDYESVITAPTCTEKGYTTYTCDCGDSYIADEVAALGHSYESVTMEPTCTEGGYTGSTCVNCGDTRVTDEVAALGHRFEAVVTAPTCTEDGCTTHTCTVCGAVEVDSVVEAYGHDNETVTVVATCTENGSVTTTCARCGETETEVIKAAGHDYESVITAPTCTEVGYTTDTCSNCGDTVISDEVDALGHSYEAVTIEATCTEAGSVTYTCACGETYTEVIEPIGHDYESVITTPTCTEGGYTTDTCGNCGDTIISDEVDALGHSYEAAVTAPTCTEGGFTTYTCICGDSYIADEVDALGHSYEAAVTAPTCTEGGFTTYTCVCGDFYIADETSALGHSYTGVESGSYMVYTCGSCGGSYSEKIASTYTQAGAFASGGRYVITVSSGGMYYALSHANNQISVVQVTVANGEITSEITEDLLWTYSGSKLSYQSGGTTYYMYNTADGNWWGAWWGGSVSVSTSASSTASFSGSNLQIGVGYLRYYNGYVSTGYNASTACIFEEA